MKKCAELKAIWDTLPGLAELTDNDWGILRAHVKKCFLCRKQWEEYQLDQTEEALEQAYYEEFENDMTEVGAKLVSMGCVSINRAQNTIMECPKMKSILEQFKKGCWPSAKEIGNIVAHSDNCPVCLQNIKKSGLSVEEYLDEIVVSFVFDGKEPENSLRDRLAENPLSDFRWFVFLVCAPNVKSQQ